MHSGSHVGLWITSHRFELCRLRLYIRHLECFSGERLFIIVGVGVKWVYRQGRYFFLVAFGMKNQDSKKFFKKIHFWRFAGQTRVVGPPGGKIFFRNQHNRSIINITDP